ncbi:uridine kinase family protein [Actinomadura atramentaria]|uniref:uridine kinase family protein n=1 Tax=Actinomadura atramentaria TaxID=1990 RepID=UPI00039AC35A|nr:AAA family ATPase [Actinomadura atramentaria]
MAAVTPTHPALAARVRRLPPSCGPVRVVAVDGPSGAGKSTFARRLAAALGAPLVAADDFPVPWDADPLVWLAPLRRAVLDPLAAGRPGALARYDWRAGRRGAPEEVPAGPALVLEGVGAAARGLPVALRIFVDAPRPLRRARVLARDGAAFGSAWDAWSVREARYFADGLGPVDMRVDGASVADDEFRVLD